MRLKNRFSILLMAGATEGLYKYQTTYKKKKKYAFKINSFNKEIYEYADVALECGQSHWKWYELVNLTKYSTVAQSLTFITFIVSENTSTWKFLPS